MLRRYSMAAAISASGNAQDSFTATRNGTIKQIIFNVILDSITDNCVVKMQVSRNSVQDFTTSAAGGAPITQSLAKCFVCGNFVTSGLAHSNINNIVECNDRIANGEALYINSIVSGTVAITLDVVLVIEEGS